MSTDSSGPTQNQAVRQSAVPSQTTSTLFSDFQRVTLTDKMERHIRLDDVAIELSTADYPRVTMLVFTFDAKGSSVLPWSSVTRWDQQREIIAANDLAAATVMLPEALENTVLLKRDVLDALVLDLSRRSATRANDLWLREDDGDLLLLGVDPSAWAILRRLSRGRLGSRAQSGMVDWRDVEFLRGDPLAAQAGRDYHRQVGRLPPAEIAHLCDALPYLHAAELLTLLPDAIAADALEVMWPERQLQVLEQLGHQHAIRVIDLMAPDLAADLLAALEPLRAQQYLEGLSEAQAARILDLLRFPPDTVGGIMTNLLVELPAGVSVATARELLRDRLQRPDFVHFVYVVSDDSDRRLLGVLSLRDILTAADDATVDSLMRRDLEAVDPLESARRAAERVADDHLAAVPVVDHNGRLLGAVTIDAAVAQIAPSSWATDAPRIFS